MAGYHVPVMFNEVLGYLVNNRDRGVIFDCTAGGGGHSKGILDNSSSIKVVAIDRDAEAIAECTNNLKKHKNRVTIYKSPFSSLGDFANGRDVQGILMDLGVSSKQIDDPLRGFSFMKDGDLDMRMDTNSELKASDIVNTYTKQDLSRIFRIYGEEKMASLVARRIVEKRETKEIKTTLELSEIVDGACRKSIKSRARIFQALRIELNAELKELEKAIEVGFDILSSNGRMLIITYHSLEDRIVKQAFNKVGKFVDKGTAIFPGDEDIIKKFKLITKKPLFATEEEIKINPRSRSAKIRVIEKL